MRRLFSRRQALVTLLAHGCWAGWSTRAAAQHFVAAGAASREIRLLFFNAHLLPGIAQAVAGHRGQDDYRTQAIAAQLHGYDLAGLCEVFEAKRRQQIVRIVQAASGGAYAVVESPPPSGRHLVGGGLLLLSRLPIVGEAHFVTYRQASRPITHGWRADGFAAKGAIHVRLQTGMEGLLVDCFLTHLESASEKARNDQIRELSDFIGEHADAKRPALLMGDLNVAADTSTEADPSGSEYERLISSLWQHRLIDSWAAAHQRGGGTSDAVLGESSRRIDYVFVSSAAPGQLAAWSIRNIRVAPLRDRLIREGSLSDHAAVECRLELSCETSA